MFGGFLKKKSGNTGYMTRCCCFVFFGLSGFGPKQRESKMTVLYPLIIIILII